MSIYWEEVVTGHLDRSLLNKLKRQIRQHLRCSYVVGGKLGITSNPEDRFLRPDYDNVYHKMVVLYKTKSLDYANRGESILIKHFKEYLDNRAPGGGGSMSMAAPPYYIYLVLRHTWRYRWFGWK